MFVLARVPNPRLLQAEPSVIIISIGYCKSRSNKSAGIDSMLGYLLYNEVNIGT